MRVAHGKRLRLQAFFSDLKDVDRDNEVNRILWAFKLNPFEKLNLRFDATPEDVKKQYRKLSLMVHPDKCKHPQASTAFDSEWGGGVGWGEVKLWCGVAARGGVITWVKRCLGTPTTGGGTWHFIDGLQDHWHKIGSHSHEPPASTCVVHILSLHH